MPKFTVVYELLVSQTATAEVEAETPEEARKYALDNDLAVSLEFSGDEIIDGSVRIYAVMNAKGETVLE